MRRGAWIAVLAAGLAACTAAPVREALPPVAGAPEAHQARREAALSAAANWSLQGRVAVSNGRDGGSGRIDWQQRGAAYDVALSAPVTRQSWRLSGDPSGATLAGLPPGPRTGPDPSALVREATRWDIPVAALAHWARGARADAAHGPAAVAYGPDGRLSRIEQAGWTIDYAEWQPTDGAMELPHRLVARRGEASVRLVVDHWSAP